MLARAVRIAKTYIHFKRHAVNFGRRPTCERWLPVISNEGRMTLGPRAGFKGREARAFVSTTPGAELTIGARAFINGGVTIYAEASVTIGDDVKIANNVIISDTGSHQVAPGEPVRRAPVTIGDNVWLGRGSCVLPGVSIGNHAVIAAGSVVTKDVPAATVVAGNPAQPIRQLAVADPNWVRS